MVGTEQRLNIRASAVPGHRSAMRRPVYAWSYNEFDRMDAA